MIPSVTSINTIRDKAGRIIGYELIDNNGTRARVKSDALKKAIRAQEVSVTNLTLTSDNRLISTDEKINTDKYVIVIDRDFIDNNIGSPDKQSRKKYDITFKSYGDKFVSLLNKAKAMGYKCITYKKRTCIVIETQQGIQFIAERFEFKHCSRLFMHCNMNKLDISEIDASQVTSMKEMFKFGHIKQLNIGNMDTNNVINMSHMFEYSVIDKIDLSGINTSNVKDMSYMFATCDTKEINLTGLDTSKVTNMSHMFDECTAKIDIRHFNTSNVIDMSYLFCGCHSDNIKVNHLDTHNVIDMSGMFSAFKCEGNWEFGYMDTSKVKDMMCMFEYSNIGNIDLSTLDLSRVSRMESMFRGCNVGSIYIGKPNNKINTKSLLNISYMFETAKVGKVVFSNLNMSSNTSLSNVVNYSGVFNDCSIKSIKFDKSTDKLKQCYKERKKRQVI
jgi:surface protein